MRKDDIIARFPAGDYDNSPRYPVSHIFRRDIKARTNTELRNLSDAEILGEEPNLLHVPAKCCRLAFQLSRDKIADIFRIYGSGIAVYEGYIEENEAFFGFDMTRPAEGFPCVHLTNEGRCGIYKQRPRVCIEYPTTIKRVENCSYTFKNGKRTGKCDGCRG